MTQTLRQMLHCMDIAHATDMINLKWEDGSQQTEISVGLGLSSLCAQQR